MKFKKIILSLLSVVILGTLVLGCSEKPKEEGETPVDPPVKEEPEEIFQETFEEVLFRGDTYKILVTDLFQEEPRENAQTILSYYNEAYESHLWIREIQKDALPGQLSLADYEALFLAAMGTMTLENRQDNAYDEQPGVRLQLSGEIEGVGTSYMVQLYAMEDHFLEILLWSFTENILQNQGYYEDLMNSFEVVDTHTEEAVEEADVAEEEAP